MFYRYELEKLAVASSDKIVIGTIKHEYPELTRIGSNISIESEISSVWTPEITIRGNLTIWSRTEIVKLIRDQLVEIDRSLIQGIDRDQFIGGTNCLIQKVLMSYFCNGWLRSLGNFFDILTLKLFVVRCTNIALYDLLIKVHTQ